MALSSENSVLRQTNGGEDYQEGNADEEIDPGQGVIWYEDSNGDTQVKLVGADHRSRRVAREQRNPPHDLGAIGDSPLDDAYTSGDNIETIGFQPHDRGLLRHNGNIATPANFEDADVGWDSNGFITDSPTTAIGRGIRVIDRGSGDDFVVVEFY